MKFRISKFASFDMSFEYIEMDFPSVEQAKKWCRNNSNLRYSYGVVREDKEHNDDWR